MGQSPADVFLRSILLAAILLAALRTPRKLFALRAMMPGELAGPGEVLASCLAGLSAGVLTCDALGRFVLASATRSNASTSRPRVAGRWLRWNLRAAPSVRLARSRALPAAIVIARAEGSAAS